jgi:hypothetical protein
MKTGFEIYKSICTNNLVEALKNIELVNKKWYSEEEINNFITVLDNDIKSYEEMFKRDDEEQSNGIRLGLLIAKANLMEMLKK